MEYPYRLREVQLTARRLLVEDEVWLVYELPALQFDRRRGSSLVFETDGTFRRVREFEANWRSLSDEDLFDLSWRA